MATQNLGRVVPLDMGDYDAGTTYELNHIVHYNESMYWHYGTAATIGVAPTNDSVWRVVLDASAMNAYASRAETAVGEVENATESFTQTTVPAAVADVESTGAAQVASVNAKGETIRETINTVGTALVSVATMRSQDAEAWAVGTRNGSIVDTFDPTYHNNSKYYADVAKDYVDHIADPVSGIVTDWLTSHPEATTTVQDHSLSADKLIVGTLNYVMPQMYGAVGDGITDDTDAIRAAVNSGKTVYIPAGHYKVRVRETEDTNATGYESGIHIPSNTSIIMDANCYLEAIPTSYGYYQVFMLRGVENVLIRGGHIVGERETHNYDSVHYRTTDNGFGIQMIGASHITIDGVTIRDCWGDGITIGRGYSGGTWEAYPDCEDITIRNCDISRCNRHGLSPTRVNNLLVDNCVIHDIYNTSDMPTYTWYGIDDECLRRTDYGMQENHVYRNIIFYGNTNKDFCANGIDGLTIDRCRFANLLQVDTSDDVTLRNSVCDAVDFSKLSQNLENISTVKIYKSEINGSMWLGLQNATIDGCAFVQDTRVHRASVRLMQSADGGSVLIQNSLLRINNDEAGIITTSTGLPDFLRFIGCTVELVGSIPYIVFARSIPLEFSECAIYENGLTTSSLFYRCDNLALVNCNVHFAKRSLYSSFTAANSKLRCLGTTFWSEGNDGDILMFTHNESGVDHPIDVLMVGNAFVNFHTLSLRMYENTKTVMFEQNFPSTLTLNYT